LLNRPAFKPTEEYSPLLFKEGLSYPICKDLPKPIIAKARNKESDFKDYTECLKDSTDEIWSDSLEKMLLTYIPDSNLEKFKTEIFKLIRNYFRVARKEEDEPDLLKTFRFDLQNGSLRYVIKKYFSNPETCYSEREVPLFIRDLHMIYSNRHRSFDMDALKQEELDLLPKTISTSCVNNKAMVKDEMLKILIHRKKQKRELEGKDFNAFVLPVGDLMAFIQRIVEKEGTHHHRVQVIVRSLGCHYTGLDIEFKDSGCACFVMDAGEDPKAKRVLRILKECAHVSEVYYGKGFMLKEERKYLQVDTYSCSTFSFDHIRYSSRHDDLFTILKRHSIMNDEGVMDVSWLDLPIGFVENAQSLSVLTEYEKRNIEEYMRPYKKCASFAEYLEGKTESAKIHGLEKRINSAALFRLKDYRKKLRLQMKEFPPSELAAIAFSYPLEEV
jgi:hypothetical protein